MATMGGNRRSTRGCSTSWAPPGDGEADDKIYYIRYRRGGALIEEKADARAWTG